MAYTVLARKYRSQGFDDVVGQESISKTLKNAIATGRVAHGFLFVGTRGVGKTTMARILAKALNCHAVDEPTTEPCGKCESCIAVNLGEDIDVIEIDGATNNGVDAVRELRQNAIYRPARSRFKIYIIDEVHMLSTGAFNALLKILEEPPSHVKFIFATTEPNKVLPTIQSRCQRFDFNNISPQLIGRQLEMVLKSEKIKYDNDVILPIAKMANGSMRDGLSLLDRLISTGADPLSADLLEEFLGCPNSEKICILISCIGESDAAGTLRAVDDLAATGLTEIQIVDSLVDYMRDLMVAKSAGADSELLILTEQQRKQVAQLAEKFDIAGIVYSIATMEKLRWTIKNSDTARALLDAMMLRFALSEHFLNVESLISQAGTGRGVKKNDIASVSTSASQAKKTDAPKPQRISSEKRGDINSIKANWQSFLELLIDRLGRGTATLLSSAEPVSFENQVVTLSFDASGKMAKTMCESNGRTGQIEEVLSEYCGQAVGLKLIVSDQNEQAAGDSAPKAAAPPRKSNKDVMNDPAVKTVIKGLEAKITGIEET